jgi:hypothetical protein
MTTLILLLILTNNLHIAKRGIRFTILDYFFFFTIFILLYKNRKNIKLFNIKIIKNSFKMSPSYIYNL